MADSNRQLVARILLVSAVIFAVLAALSWSGTLPIDRGAHHLFALAFGICAALDALIGLVLLTAVPGSRT
jgi:hypothetical protein